MIYVIDKNTNRVIYKTHEGQRFLLDNHTYRVDAPDFDFGQLKLWSFRWNKEKGTFVLADDPAAVRPPTPAPIDAAPGAPTPTLNPTN